MNKLANIRFVPLGNSIYIKPFKMLYEQNGKEKSWDMMEIHDSVAVVIYNVTREVMIFVKQFRPGVYYSHIKPEDRDQPISTTKYPAELGITLELCAGIKDKDIPLIDIAKEEVLEETGYDCPMENFEKIHAWNASVGISGNVLTLFYCWVTDDMKTGCGGGVGDEIIDVVEMTIPQVRNFVTKEIIPSPGSLLTGFYWFIINKFKNNESI